MHVAQYFLEIGTTAAQALPLLLAHGFIKYDHPLLRHPAFNNAEYRAYMQQQVQHTQQVQAAFDLMEAPRLGPQFTQRSALGDISMPLLTTDEQGCSVAAGLVTYGSLSAALCSAAGPPDATIFMLVRPQERESLLAERRAQPAVAGVADAAADQPAQPVDAENDAAATAAEPAVDAAGHAPSTAAAAAAAPTVGAAGNTSGGAAPQSTQTGEQASTAAGTTAAGRCHIAKEAPLAAQMVRKAHTHRLAYAVASQHIVSAVGLDSNWGLLQLPGGHMRATLKLLRSVAALMPERNSRHKGCGTSWKPRCNWIAAMHQMCGTVTSNQPDKDCYMLPLVLPLIFSITAYITGPVGGDATAHAAAAVCAHATGAGGAESSAHNTDPAAATLCAVSSWQGATSSCVR